jgi:hypothetical protein
MLLQLGQMVHKEIEHGWFYLQPLAHLPENEKIMTSERPYNHYQQLQKKKKVKLFEIGLRNCKPHLSITRVYHQSGEADIRIYNGLIDTFPQRSRRHPGQATASPRPGHHCLRGPSQSRPSPPPSVRQHSRVLPSMRSKISDPNSFVES